VVRQALYLAVLIGVASGAALAMLAPTLVSLFDPAEAVQAPAVAYLRIRAMAVPALLVITAGHGAYRGFQDTRTPLVVILIVNGINAVLDPILMFGVGLGLEGAAVATVIAQGIGAIVFLSLLHRRSRAERWPRGRVRLARAMPLLRVGGVLIVRTLLLVSSLALATAAATRFGTESVAAHQIVSQIWFLLAMIVDALAIAAQAMVAELAGAGERSAARILSARLLRWGLVAGLVLGASLWLIGGRIGALFTDDPAVRAEVAVAIGIAAIMQPVAALVFVADGVYMAMVGVRWLAVSTAAGFLAMLVGSVLAVQMDWGLAGVWWAITAMVVARGVVLASGYRRLFAVAGVSG
jgi:MATE family multidrug resistance protein